MGIILGIVGVLAAVAIAILIYCFCCKTESDDGYQKVGDENQV